MKSMTRREALKATVMGVVSAPAAVKAVAQPELLPPPSPPSKILYWRQTKCFERYTSPEYQEHLRKLIANCLVRGDRIPESEIPMEVEPTTLNYKREDFPLKGFHEMMGITWQQTPTPSKKPQKPDNLNGGAKENT